MTDIQLYNTATRKKERFEPLNPENVRMYVCGPTVYDRAHIGNARPVIVFDTLFRLLRHVYGPDHVTYVRNFTDVDDKINARAAAEGRPIRDITDETTRWYLEDMAAVGALKPTEMPRATDWIGEMIAMAEGLIEKGHAYETEGHVLFRVRSYTEYGALSGRSVDDMIAGARVEVAPFKEDPMDFVIWKPSDAGTPGWESPWGRGRPGWHIECSAMAFGLLGAEFDIHGGGNDLQFPHHENEIAQSKCMGHGFARYWMHNEMLQVEGKKMSKSLGNFFTVRDLLDQGVPGEVIRFVFLSTHYRKPMDWTAEKAREAEGHLNAWFNIKRKWLSEPISASDLRRLADKEFVGLLANDLNTPGALARLMELAKMARDKVEVDSDEVRAFVASAKMLGFKNFDAQSQARKNAVERAFEKADVVRSLLDARTEAKLAKDFQRADEIRDALIGAGVAIKDTPEGSSWEPTSDFDPSKLEALK